MDELSDDDQFLDAVEGLTSDALSGIGPHPQRRLELFRGYVAIMLAVLEIDEQELPLSRVSPSRIL